MSILYEDIFTHVLEHDPLLGQGVSKTYHKKYEFLIVEDMSKELIERPITWDNRAHLSESTVERYVDNVLRMKDWSPDTYLMMERAIDRAVDGAFEHNAFDIGGQLKNIVGLKNLINNVCFDTMMKMTERSVFNYYKKIDGICDLTLDEKKYFFSVRKFGRGRQEYVLRYFDLIDRKKRWLMRDYWIVMGVYVRLNKMNPYEINYYS